MWLVCLSACLFVFWTVGKKNPQESREDVLQTYEAHVKLCMKSKGSELKIEFLKLDPETVWQQHYSF